VFIELDWFAVEEIKGVAAEDKLEEEVAGAMVPWTLLLEEGAGVVIDEIGVEEYESDLMGSVREEMEVGYVEDEEEIFFS